MVDVMPLKSSLKAAELQDGDIICFQKEIDTKYAVHEELVIFFIVGVVQTANSSSAAGRPLPKNSRAAMNGSATRPAGWIDEAPQFYEYLLLRKVVHFRPHSKNPEPYVENLDIELSSKSNYDQVSAKVGEKLGVDPTHLRFHTVANSTGAVKAPVKRMAGQTLASILNPSFSTFANNNTKTDELYYEVLEMSLAEFDTKKLLKVTWISEGITKDVSGRHGSNLICVC